MAIHIAASDAESLAMAASFVNFTPKSFIRAAFQVSRRAAWRRVAMSEIKNWIAWSLAIGAPNCSRSDANFLEASNAQRAIPSAWEAIPIRPPSRVESAILRPWPSLPSRQSSGTNTSSKKSCAVEEAQIPSLSSSFAT